MNFGKALESLKADGPVSRVGWYGKHYLTLHLPGREEPSTHPYIVIHTENGEVVPWLASQSDMLAEDWQVP